MIIFWISEEQWQSLDKNQKEEQRLGRNQNLYWKKIQQIATFQAETNDENGL